MNFWTAISQKQHCSSWLAEFQSFIRDIVMCQPRAADNTYLPYTMSWNEEGHGIGLLSL